MQSDTKWNVAERGNNNTLSFASRLQDHSHLGAQIRQRAFVTLRFAGVADGSAVQDHPVAEAGPFRLRDQLVQGELRLHRVGVAGEAQAAREPTHTVSLPGPQSIVSDERPPWIRSSPDPPKM